MALQFLKESWKTLVIIFSPIILLPLALPGTTKESKCAYGLFLMCIYWITEAIPLAVTALLPIVIFPVIGVAPSKALSKHYFKDIDFLLIGGLIIAIAIEKCNIHKRFALRLLMFFGVSPRRFLFSFLFGTAFMSMWISNTAATTMMLPIARALLDRLFTIEQQVSNVDDRETLMEDSEQCNNLSSCVEEVELQVTVSQSGNDAEQAETDDNDTNSLTTSLDFSKLDERSKNLVKAISLSICYGANCGGIATLTGTPTNLVTKAHADDLANGNSGITFLSWMVFTVPISLISLFFVWFWLQIVFLGPRATFSCRRNKKERSNVEIMGLVRKEHEKLGPMSFSEYVVVIHLICLILLWLMRNPGFIPGYGQLFLEGYITDAVPAVLVALGLFIFPKKWPRQLYFKKKDSGVPGKTESIIVWSDVNSSLPWGIILLLGGGFALAEACQISHLTELIANKLSIIKGLGPQAACLVLVLMICTVTEVASNTVIVSLFMPIVSELAVSMDIHPLYFMLPAGLTASFAYMLPVATPPNAVVFSYGDVRVIDMVKAGLVLNVFNVLLVTLAINTWGIAYFDLNQFPDWAKNHTSLLSNSTG